MHPNQYPLDHPQTRLAPYVRKTGKKAPIKKPIEDYLPQAVSESLHKLQDFQFCQIQETLKSGHNVNLSKVTIKSRQNIETLNIGHFTVGLNQCHKNTLPKDMC